MTHAQRRLPLAGGMLLAAALHAQAVSFQFAVDRPLPDGSASGLADTRSLGGVAGTISHLTVDLHLAGRGAGGWNGDLYATLVHGSGFAVLLNRPGKRLDDPLGFDDSGLAVTFDDRAAHDIHTYRLPLTGDFSTPLSSPLDGVWQPDGRETDPADVGLDDARTLRLDSFHGLDPNGRWTLFLADLEFGSTAQVISWGLNIRTATPVPDSGVPTLAILATLALAWGGRGSFQSAATAKRD